MWAAIDAHREQFADELGAFLPKGVDLDVEFPEEEDDDTDLQFTLMDELTGNSLFEYSAYNDDDLDVQWCIKHDPDPGFRAINEDIVAHFIDLCEETLEKVKAMDFSNVLAVEDEIRQSPERIKQFRLVDKQLVYDLEDAGELSQFVVKDGQVWYYSRPTLEEKVVPKMVLDLQKFNAALAKADVDLNLDNFAFTLFSSKD